MVRSSCTIQQASTESIGGGKWEELKHVRSNPIRHLHLGLTSAQPNRSESQWACNASPSLPPHSITMALHRIGRRCGQAVCCRRIYLCSAAGRDWLVWDTFTFSPSNKCTWTPQQMMVMIIIMRTKIIWEYCIYKLWLPFPSMSLGLHVLNENIFLKPWSII